MGQITVSRAIHAPADIVFKTISDINYFSEAVPDIVDVEFLSDTKSGVGTRFRETRMMSGREAQTVLEVTEMVNNDHIRLVSDTSGTIWDSIFRVIPKNSSTILILEMSAEPHTFWAKLLTPLMQGFIKKALEKDMDAVKKYCEK